MSCELSMINHIIMGIGINVNLDKNDFCKEVSKVGTSLKIETGRKMNRKMLLAEVLNMFEKLYIPFSKEKDLKRVIKICRENSILIGKEVKIIYGSEEKFGKAIDINEEGELVVQYKNGEIENVFSGEVSVRGLYSYV